MGWAPGNNGRGRIRGWPEVMPRSTGGGVRVGTIVLRGYKSSTRAGPATGVQLEQSIGAERLGCPLGRTRWGKNRWMNWPAAYKESVRELEPVK